MRRSLRLVAAVYLLCPLPLAAQLEPLGAPKGTFRFDIGGRFASADRRLFDGSEEDYLADFGGSALGSTQVAGLSTTDSALARILGQAGYHLNLGRAAARGQLTVGSGIIGGALGITSRLTLFARVPFVTTRVQARLTLDSTAGDGGLNPAHPDLGNATDQARAVTFFSTFDQALADLAARISGGSYAGNPTLDSLARSIVARGTAMRNDLALITNDGLGASAFLPSAASPTGLLLTATLRALSDTMVSTLGVGTALVDPVLAASRLTEGEFQSALTSAAGPYAAFPLQESKISRAGDTEVGAIYTLVDRFDRRGRRGGFRLALTGMMKLPTGQRDNPASYLDVGTGEGRYEVGGVGTADLGAGRWGLRLNAGYTARLPSLRVRRVAPPGTPYTLASSLANIKLDVGDVVSLGVQPFFRLAPRFALSGSADYWKAGSDKADWYRAGDAIPGVDPGLLTAQSSRSALAVGGGVSYVGWAAHECERGRRCGLPIDASWRYTTVIAATGGRVEKFRMTRLEIRWYQRIWR